MRVLFIILLFFTLANGNAASDDLKTLMQDAEKGDAIAQSLLADKYYKPESVT
jgi:hypothetical protein